MNQLNVVDQKLVQFGDYELLAVKTNNGKVHAAVKWVCQGVGLTDDQAKRQVKNIQSDLVVSKGVSNLTLPTNGGLQEVLCIELDFLPLWLAKISITPNMQETNSKAVENLVNYQLKAKDVLAEAFLPKMQPTTQAELIAMMAQQGVEQERRLNEVEQRASQLESQHDNIVSILSLTTIDWRNKVNRIINAIAMKLGGMQYFKDVRNESYLMLEQRAGCLLERRLENRKSKMALRGMSNSAINKINKLDVIAEDKKLISVYVTVIKEMAVKYQLDIQNYELKAPLAIEGVN
ncbi:phage antirepressor N-terminal domain-containing protein [Solibacillus silvestris]